MLHTLVTFFLLAPFCCAQNDKEMRSLVHDLVARLKSPDNVAQYQMPDFEVEITNDTDINASGNAYTHKILLNKSLVQVFFNAPGELAFVIAHEIGHVQNDVGCRLKWGKQGLSGLALKREIEDEADQIGMQYLLAAGFGPYDAAGAMGRFLMADPGRNGAVAMMINRFTSDHPVTNDRIKHLANFAIQTCEDRPEICQR